MKKHYYTIMVFIYHIINISLFTTSYYIQYKNDLFEVGFIYILLAFFFILIELIKLLSYKTLFSNKPNKNTFFLTVIFSFFSIASNYKSILIIDTSFSTPAYVIIFMLAYWEILVFYAYFTIFSKKR